MLATTDEQLPEKSSDLVNQRLEAGTSSVDEQ